MAQGATAEFEDLLTQCDRAITDVRSTRPDRLVLLGSVRGHGSTAVGLGQPRRFRGTGRGTFSAWRGHCGPVAAVTDRRPGSSTGRSARAAARSESRSGRFLRESGCWPASTARSVSGLDSIVMGDGTARRVSRRPWLLGRAVPRVSTRARSQLPWPPVTVSGARGAGFCCLAAGAAVARALRPGSPRACLLSGVRMDAEVLLRRGSGLGRASIIVAGWSARG